MKMYNKIVFFVVMLALLVFSVRLASAAEVGTTVDCNTPVHITVDYHWKSGKVYRDYIDMELFSVWKVGFEDEVMVGLKLDYAGDYYSPLGDVFFTSPRDNNDLLYTRVYPHEGYSVIMAMIGNVTLDSRGNMKLHFYDVTDSNLKFIVIYLPEEDLTLHAKKVITKMLLMQE